MVLKWQVVVGGNEPLTIVVNRWPGGRLVNLQSSQYSHRLSTYLFPATMHFSFNVMY